MTGLVDVARRAGVSPATASRVLSGAGPASAASRERVLAAAGELGYAAHPVARMLAKGDGTRIVLAVRDDRADALRDPFVSRATAAVAEVADAAGLGVALRQLPLDCAAGLETIAADRSVAALVLTGHDTATLGALPRRLSGRTAAIGVGAPGVPNADVDSRAGFGALLRHLHEQGRRRVVLVGGPRWLGAARAPLAAYADFALAIGVPPRSVTGAVTVERGRAATYRILSRWPDTDAIVAVSDAVALGVLDALHELGRRVPDDVAVTGFDDAPVAGPALTTATHPVERIATAAATAALTGVRETRLFPSHPVLRQTT
ncbi:DNA-binding LacI/PurR family transcriptional regulator [Actinoplanes tereljensis]|uniref:LacI family transcriptional regulator n=1 Tax=Paractinoplanes tereljensis TaxID=571912 RepID=A0A919TSF9_9ACTN|nr:LacI family DNA-binding transcriptional regulator [Actinoplanes tereljensis]GIF20209.1 LacI family transcriptional regulator [Actinoplanes tereljensis]